MLRPGGVDIMRDKPKMTISLIKSTQGAVTQAASEAEALLGAAFDEHWPSVCQTLYYLVGDRDEAQDLALEVFYRLHTRPPRDLTGLGGWLHRVATNVGLNAIRARRRRRRYEETAGALKLQRAVPVNPFISALSVPSPMMVAYAALYAAVALALVVWNFNCRDL